MFSLQTIFGKGDKFYGLLEASAESARSSARELIELLRTLAAQQSLGIIALAIFSANSADTLDQLPTWADFLRPDGGEQDIDAWIVFACALIMACGTAVGGWRIIKTLGHKMVKLHPINGFAAETSSATILLTAAHFGMPVSTTHSISTAIMGVGFAKNPHALKLTVIERIVWAWVLTIPAAGVSWSMVSVLLLLH
jgi:PiT family inorganic phosphate transporter